MPSLSVYMLILNSVLNLAMKTTTLPVLHATRLVDQVGERACYKHYSLLTEDATCNGNGAR